jgi:hypothetical protein
VVEEGGGNSLNWFRVALDGGRGVAQDHEVSAGRWSAEGALRSTARDSPRV